MNHTVFYPLRYGNDFFYIKLFEGQTFWCKFMGVFYRRKLMIRSFQAQIMPGRSFTNSELCKPENSPNMVGYTLEDKALTIV